MGRKVTVIEKPDYVGWDDIKACLWEAHAPNREKGIEMGHYQWTSEAIRDYVGENGRMLVAMDGDKLVGTAAFSVRKGMTWYTSGRQYAYLCFGSLLPDYNGRGIYKELTEKRQEIIRGLGLGIMLFDTHENNRRVQEISVMNGFKYVKYFQASSHDHYNVVMVKWIDGCPYSDLYCRYQFLKSKFLARVSKMKKKNG